MDHIITSLLKNTLSSRCCFKLLPRVIPESMLLVVSLLLALIQVVVMIYSVVSFLILWHVDVHGAQPNLSNPLSREVHSFLGFLVQTHKSTNFFKNSIAFNFFFFSFFFFFFFFLIIPLSLLDLEWTNSLLQIVLFCSFFLYHYQTSKPNQLIWSVLFMGSGIYKANLNTCLP